MSSFLYDIILLKINSTGKASVRPLSITIRSPHLRTSREASDGWWDERGSQRLGRREFISLVVLVLVLVQLLLCK